MKMKFKFSCIVSCIICAVCVNTARAENIVKLSMDFTAKKAAFQCQNYDTGVYYALWKTETTELKSDVLTVGMGIANYNKITMSFTSPTTANLSQFILDTADIAFQIADSLQKSNIIGDTFAIDISSMNLYKKYKLTGDTEYTWESLFPDNTKMFDDAIALLLSETESEITDVYFTIAMTGNISASATALIPFKVTTNAKLDDKTMIVPLFPDPDSGKAWNDPAAEKIADESKATFADIIKIAVNVSNSHVYSKLDFYKTEFFQEFAGRNATDAIPLIATNTAWTTAVPGECPVCPVCPTTAVNGDYDGNGKLELKDILSGLQELTK